MTHMEWEGNVRELKNLAKDAERSLNLFNRNVERKGSETGGRESLFDIPFLFDRIIPPLERYWAIRKFTTLDDLLLNTNQGALEKVKICSCI